MFKMENLFNCIVTVGFLKSLSEVSSGFDYCEDWLKEVPASG